MRNWFFDQMAMYAAYHQDHRNQMTHYVGVPMIVFSLMIIGSTVTVMPMDGGHISLAAVLISALLLLYIAMVPLVGVLAAIMYLALLYGAEQIGALGMTPALQWFGGLFVLGWIIQLWGHVYEGRKPALVDNALQVFMAPSFLIAELLFKVGMQDNLHQEIENRKGAYLPTAE